MPFSDERLQQANEKQLAAANDTAAQIRLIAGPGAGKSKVISQRVKRLLAEGVSARNIQVVSFTRASTRDLKKRILKDCEGDSGVGDVRVSTLHSFVLGILAKSGGLRDYGTAKPQFLDDWEQGNLYDDEFQAVSGEEIRRVRQIRVAWEAYWATNSWAPPNYVPPDNPITDEEKASFERFHRQVKSVYGCILPGEIIRKCVESIHAGELDLASQISTQHLIVDEFQDLNECDTDFVDMVAETGANIFVAGDDDQSIYSFRFAFPQAIQTFSTRYPDFSDHILDDCFRCTPNILATTETLITRNSSTDRVAKTMQSMFVGLGDQVQGVVHRWKFTTPKKEAAAIAKSCRELIKTIPGKDIYILISNGRVQCKAIKEALTEEGVDFIPPKEESYRDTKEGRAILSILRIIKDPNDRVAHRTLLGLTRNSSGSCHEVVNYITNNNLGFLEMFHDELSDTTPTAIARKLSRAREVCITISTWSLEDRLDQRIDEIAKICKDFFGATKTEELWINFCNETSATTLGEVLDEIWNDKPTDDERSDGKIRVMTMHSAKGLDAKVVFIPGIEKEILPGPNRMPYVGLINESARMLHVAVTRAKAACIISYCTTRSIQGNFQAGCSPQFITDLAGPFLYRTNELSQVEIQAITETSNEIDAINT